jgi:hypothetical protein
MTSANDAPARCSADGTPNHKLNSNFTPAFGVKQLCIGRTLSRPAAVRGHARRAGPMRFEARNPRKMQDQSIFHSLWSSIPGFHLACMQPRLRHHAAEGFGCSPPYRTGSAYCACEYITHRSPISRRLWCYRRRRRANRGVLLERILHPSLQKWLQIDDGI